MDLARITAFAFYEQFSRIGEQFDDQERCSQLLDQARREIPLVDNLYGLLVKTKGIPDESDRDLAFNRIMHDIHLIITLWQLSRQADHGNAVPRNLPEAPPQVQVPLRFRRAADN